ncbi:hypothetical protein KI387_016399, partial [Taxus chinensis]
FGASDNVMPLKVVKALKLTMIPPSGSYYSLESREVPLVGKVKDAQVALTRFPDKK